MIRNSVDFIVGTASLIDPHRISIKQESESNEHTADYIVIAVGTETAHPPGVPFDDESVIDSDGLLSLKQLPKSLTIVGGGVIGCEYACILATLGIPVVLVERRPRLLEFVDSEIIESLQYQMRNIGVTLRLNEEVVGVSIGADQSVVLHLKSGKQIRSPLLVYSAGRVGATKNLGLEQVGIEPDERGRLKVNENFQTAVPHIYAAGDVVGFPALASTSMQQGRHAACHAFGLVCETSSHLLPYGIYTIPEISMVGRNEDELTRDGVPYEIGIARYREIARGQIIGDTVGMLKLLFHSDTRELLGVHVIGEGATELVHIGQAVIAHGGKLDYFVDTVFNYPTLAECYKVRSLPKYFFAIASMCASAPFSVISATSPRMATCRYALSGSRMEMATRLSRRMFWSLILSFAVLIQMSDPSKSIQTGVTCGLPSFVKVARWAKTGLAHSSFTTSGMFAAIYFPPLRKFFVSAKMIVKLG